MAHQERRDIIVFGGGSAAREDAGPTAECSIATSFRATE